MLSSILDPSGKPYNRNGTSEYGSFAIPQILTYSAVLSSGGDGQDRTYFQNAWDEAVKHSREDALVMRRDAFLMSLLQERKLAVASIPWELEVPNEKDPKQRLVRDTLKAAIEGISDLRRIMYALLEATWYGRYAVELEWEWQQIQGAKVLTVCDWVPVNGDKLGWSFGGVPYILVNPAMIQDRDDLQLVPTNAGGMGLLLKGTWRNRFIIHRHEMDDGDYFEPEAAAGVWGVGIRSRIFWLDWIRREYLEWITTFLERVGLGVTLWYYDGGNQQALDAVQKAAREQSRRANLFVPIFTDGKGSPKGLVERIETPVNGVDALRLLKEDIEQKIERFVVGQEASSKSEGSSGLGNAEGARFQMDTKSNITNFDAQNLSETMTGNARNPGLVYLMQRWSFPETMPDKPNGFRVKWKFAVEKQDTSEKLEAIAKVVSFGISVRADDARQAAGLSKPDPGDELIQPQQGMGLDPSGAPQAPGASNPAAPGQGGPGEQDQMLGAPMTDDEEAESVLGPDAVQAMYQRDMGEALSKAARETDTNPSEDQKKSGNYRKGKVWLHGMNISIENPRGSFRSGKSKDGKEWRTEMKHHYGYIKSTESEADGDHIDVFIGPHPESELVYIIDQVRPDSGRFDEHKCMLGFFSEDDAKKGYLDCYEKGWKGIGGITPLTMDQFKEWTIRGNTGERAAEQFSRDGEPLLYRANPGVDVQAPHPTVRTPKVNVNPPNPNFASPGAAKPSASAGDWIKDIGPHGGIRWINKVTGEKAYASAGRNPKAQHGGARTASDNPQQQQQTKQMVVQRKKANGQALAHWYAHKWNLLTELGMTPEEHEMDSAGQEIFGSGVALWHDEEGTGQWHVIPLDQAEEKPEEEVLPEQKARASLAIHGEEMRSELFQYLKQEGCQDSEAWQAIESVTKRLLHTK